jgi:mRNA-degrading endonuclease RelE of RelBE toxin-antitoxin system
VYRLEITHEFEKAIAKLDRDVVAKVVKKLEWLSQHPQVLKSPLKNLPHDLKDLHKYRIGDYRVLLWVDHNSQTLTLYGVEHRKSAYDRLRRRK